MKKFLATAALVAFSTTPVLADDNDSAAMGVSGAIVAALELTVTDMTLPTVVKPAAGEADNSVTIACAAGAAAPDSKTYGGDSDPGTNVTGDALNGVCGVGSTTGEAGYTFDIVADTVSGFPADTSFLPACEAATGTVGTDFACGGTLTVTADAATGAFTGGTFNVTVTYN